MGARSEEQAVSADGSAQVSTEDDEEVLRSSPTSVEDSWQHVAGQTEPEETEPEETVEASDTPSQPAESTPDGEESGDAAQEQTTEQPAERPIDVFFSAKSHLGTHRVSRGTRTVGKSSTTSRRNGTGRAQMPDLLSERSSVRSAASASSPVVGWEAAEQDVSEGPSVVEPPASDAEETSAIQGDVAESPSTPENSAWTAGVTRAEGGGTVEGAEFRAVPVEAIQPNPRQPRTEFDEDHMAELIHSVREIGVLQPIVVRVVGDGEYELVMGERRWRAAKSAGHAEIPAIVRSTRDDNLLRDALLENIHRSQLNPLEEAAAYRQLLDDFNCTQDELAERIGRSRPQISNTLRLMKLPPAVQRRVAAGVLSSGHARALLGLTTPEEMESLATRIVAEGLSVRATEEAVTMAQQKDNENGVSRGTNRLPSTARYQQLDEYAEALTDRLDTQVKITLGAKKGRIAIDFGSIEDLHRLMELIAQEQRVS
ncbi:ParB/RepB/Spo0J family partition protein [Nesterenkonia suensis]